MGELKNFPFKLQEHSPTMDGKPDENKDLNCVQTCIAAGLQYFNGKEYEPDEVKDATYGQGYVGCTSAVSDVAYCSTQGVKLYAISGSPDYLVAQAHTHLAQSHAVIVTVPVNYLPPKDRMNPGMSHAVALYKDSPGVLIAMNPLQAIAQANTDKWWSDRLCFNQIWIMEKGTMSGIPQGWGVEKDAQGKVVALVCPNTKKRVVLGFMAWVMAHNWNPSDEALEDEHGSVQLFNSRRLKWTPQAGVFEVFIGPECLQAEAAAAQAESEKKALQAQVEALKAQPKTDNTPIIHSLTSIADSIQNLVDSIS